MQKALTLPKIPRVNPKEVLTGRLMDGRTWPLYPLLILYLLAYSLSGVPRTQLLKPVSKKETFREISKPFKKVEALMAVGFSQAKALKMVGDTTPGKILKGFLSRFAQAISAGEDPSEFLEREYDTALIAYRSLHERAMVKIRRLADAYTAVISSYVFVSVNLVIMMIMWGSNWVRVLNLIIVSSALTLGSMSMAIYAAAHPSKVVIVEKIGGRIPRPLLVALASTVVSAIPIVFIYTRTEPPIPPVFFVAASGGFSMFFGMPFVKKVRTVKAMDEHYPTFIAALTGTMSALGGRLREALTEVLRIDFGPLTKLVRRMLARVKLGIDHKTCWRVFGEESGSELIRFHTDVFVDSTSAGAPVGRVGELIRRSVLEHLTLRKRREEAVAYVRGLLMPLHPALSAVLGLITAISTTFSRIISQYQLTAEIPFSIIRATPPAMIELCFYSVLIVFTLMNSLAMSAVEGSQSPLPYYMGLFTMSGGAAFFLTKAALEALISKALGGLT